MLEQFPRVPLAHLPTPLEHLSRLSAELGGPQRGQRPVLVEPGPKLDRFREEGRGLF